MDIFSYIAIGVVAIFLILLLFKNKKAAQREMNSLSDINYNSQSCITFDDIAGNYEAKESLKEIADLIKNSEKYRKFNVKTPKGVLLYGTPGTGKTLLAKALAGEAGVNFFAVSGSDFVQVYAGLGASRIRSLFAKAKKSKRSVIFIDEIDAIGKKRMGGAARGSDEGDRTLNALLTEMSGFEDNKIVVVAATNRIDTLDSALLRPGRFDRQIEIMLPDKNARRDIIKLYLEKTNYNKNMNIDKIAEQTVYFSGAKLEGLINEASIIAVKEKSKLVEEKHIDKAFLSVVAGIDQKHSVISEEQKKITAYHEAGHAYVSKLLIPENKLIKVSIIPTTKGAGGYTLSTPDDELIYTKEKIEKQIMIFLAGRGVEEIFFGYNNITIGAQNDIEKATQLALDYITKFGMSKEAGLINYRILTEGYNIDVNIEQLVKSFIDELYKKAKEIIQAHRKSITVIANLLIEKETIDNVEINKIFSN